MSAKYGTNAKFSSNSVKFEESVVATKLTHDDFIRLELLMKLQVRNPHHGLSALKKLIDHGVPVDAVDHDGRQPLLWAASSGISNCDCELRFTYYQLTTHASLHANLNRY